MNATANISTGISRRHTSFQSPLVSQHECNILSAVGKDGHVLVFQSPLVLQHECNEVQESTNQWSFRFQSPLVLQHECNLKAELVGEVSYVSITFGFAT